MKITTPLPAAVREILSGVLHDFDGCITALCDIEWMTGPEEERWVARMADDLEPLRKLLDADRKLRSESE